MLTPPTMRVPNRPVPEFGATAKLKEPAPVPDAGGVSVIQPSSLEDTHTHPLGAVTTIVPLPPNDVKWLSLIAT